MSTFLLRRPVDWSLLTNGFHIPTEFHPLVYATPGGELHHGDKRGVKIMIDGEVFDARMNNIGFDQTRYPGHPDLLQIRYSPGSPIARKLQRIFADEFEYLKLARESAAPRTQVQLPEEFLSPSYHRIIHKAKPVFDRPSLSFHFPNGLVEKVKVDKHLNV